MNKKSSRKQTKKQTKKITNLRLAIAQINPTLGDFSANADKIIDYIDRAHEKKCDLVVFPEGALFGYHPFDLLERTDIVDEQLKNLSRIQKHIPKGVQALVGCIAKNSAKKGRPFFNSLALICRGKPIKFYHKTLLPTGDVFDEARFIETGDVNKNVIKIGGKKLLLTICEDIWAWPQADGSSPYKENPLQKIPKQKIDLVINVSGSPYYPGKEKLRQYMVGQTAKHFKAPVVYANLVGAQDEIIFDGGSFCMTPKQKIVAQCARFEEDLNLFDVVTCHGGMRSVADSESENIRQSLVLGIRDFCNKVGLQRVHLGLSGGIDSALVACLAVDALGASRVSAMGLPGPYSSDLSLQLAKKLAQNLGIRFEVFSIENSYNQLTSELNKHLGASGLSLMHENLQARLRAIVLMARSNHENSMLLSTSNKSEIATGYSTLYGDMCGGLAPIGDLTKSQVYALANLYNLEYELIPREIITRPPTAELRPDQKDQDTLPPYEELDKAVCSLVEECLSAKTKTEKWLLPTLMRNEFKRWQSPPILKVSKHSFGRGRRWPIAHK